MLSPGKGGSAPVYGHALGHATYERHRPEQTLLYRLIEKHYPALVEQLEFQGKSLPAHVHREFEAYLKCGRLEHGFLRVRCDRLSLRATRGVLLQEARILSQLWRPPYGRDSRPSLGRDISRCTASPVGDQFSFPSTLPVRRPPSGNG